MAVFDQSSPYSDEQALVAGMRQGDEAAFEQFDKAYGDYMYRCALKVLRHQEAAKDCVQETHVKIFRWMDRFDGRSSLKTWVSHIAGNTAIDMVRKQVVRSVDYLEDIPENRKNFPNMLGDPEEYVSYCETLDGFQRVIETLSPKRREAFLLRHVHGLTYAEMMQVLGTTKEALAACLTRARKAFKVAAEEDPGFAAELRAHGFLPAKNGASQTSARLKK